MQIERKFKKWAEIAAGCVVLAGAVLSVGCVNKPNDAQLVTTIQSEMFSDAQLKGASLQVTSSGGQVTLKGSVPTDAARYEAYKIVTQTSGVTKVNDMMTVENQTAQAVAPPPEPEAGPVPAPASEPTAIKHVVKPAPKPAHQKLVNKAVHHQKPPVEIASNSPAALPPPPPPQQSAAPVEQQAPPPAAPAEPVAAPAPPPPPPPPPPQPKQVQIPASTTVTVRTIDPVDSSVNKAGETFHASLDAPLVVGSDVIVPKGADVYLRLASVSSAGKISGQSELRLELIRLEYQGQSYPLVTTAYEQSGASRGKDTAKKVGGGAILGAIIGAVAGGGKGAAIGATVGGGAGGVYQGATHGQQVKIPSETKLDFQLDQPVTITVQPRLNS